MQECLTTERRDRRRGTVFA